MSNAAWLQKRHASWQTPDDIVEGLVRAATGAGIAERERIIKGEANETYRIVDDAGHGLVVKIAHGSRGRFAHLEGQVSLLRDVGVLAPEVLLREVIELPSGPAAAVVQRFLPGAALLDLAGSLSGDEVGRLVEEAGALLARFHSVLAPDEPIAFSEQCIKEMEQDMELGAASLVARGFDPDEIRALVVEHASLLDRWPQCLTHGDYGPDHIIVDDGHVTGVIDLDSACAGVPVVDVSWWDTFFDRPPHPSASLVAGYERIAPLGDHATARVVYSVASGVGKLQYFVEHERQGAAEFIANGLRRWIDRLSVL